MMTKEEIYEAAIDGLATRADHFRHLSLVRYSKGKIEESEEYDKKRHALLEKIKWLKEELTKEDVNNDYSI